jgi:hypothetical protein
MILPGRDHDVDIAESSRESDGDSCNSNSIQSTSTLHEPKEPTQIVEESTVNKLTRRDSKQISIWKYAVVVFTVIIAAGVDAGTYRLLSSAAEGSLARVVSGILQG